MRNERETDRSFTATRLFHLRSVSRSFVFPHHLLTSSVDRASGPSLRATERGEKVSDVERRLMVYLQFTPLTSLLRSAGTAGEWGKLTRGDRP